jgi:hypothetical protein
MKYPAIIFFLLGILIVSSPQAKIKNVNPKIGNASLLEKFKIHHKKQGLVQLKKATLASGGKAVPTLIEVMKNGSYPDRNRWVATFLLGKIMGKKAAPFVAKFTKHPNWIMRMAALKTLLALKQKNYSGLYVRALKDKSYIVRVQALDNIKQLKLRRYGSQVWSMLYDKQNYYNISNKDKSAKNGVKRTDMIKKIIKTVGDLQFQKAEAPLLAMMQKKKYRDIYEEIDYGLKLITGKQSPKGNSKVKQIFWNKHSLRTKTI